MSEPARGRLAELRRDLHRYPEPGWCEFHTTGRLTEELRAIGPGAHDPAGWMVISHDERLADL